MGKQVNSIKAVKTYLDIIVPIAVEKLLEQTKFIIKTKEKREALADALCRILHGLEYEVHYHDLSKSINMGSLAQLLEEIQDGLGMGKENF